MKPNELKADIEWHISSYTPSHWIVPISDVDFSPRITEEEAVGIANGKIPATKDFQKWYIIEAVRAWWKKNNITF